MHAATATAPVRRFDEVCEIIERHERRAERLIPILQEVQAAYRYLPKEVLTFVATALRLPPAQVYGVATFYAHFALEPKGKHVFRVCDGTACHVKGSTALIDALRGALDMSEGQETTHDMMFTVEKVSCLGACGLAPVLVLDEAVRGQISPEASVALVDDLKSEEA